MENGGVKFNLIKNWLCGWEVVFLTYPKIQLAMGVGEKKTKSVFGCTTLSQIDNTTFIQKKDKRKDQLSDTSWCS